MFSQVTTSRCLLAAVEYNKRKIYLGHLTEENKFVFCKTPIGVICLEKFVFKKSFGGYTLNHTDEQVIEPQYVIYKFKGNVKGDTIVENDVDKKELEREIANYINKRSFDTHEKFSLWP